MNTGSSNTTWSSTGWPRLDNARKNRRSGFAGGTQLVLYHKDLTELKRRLETITSDQYDEAYQSKHNAWIGGRSEVLSNFKPGTKSFHLIFSGRDGEGTYCCCCCCCRRAVTNGAGYSCGANDGSLG